MVNCKLPHWKMSGGKTWNYLEAAAWLYESSEEDLLKSYHAWADCERQAIPYEPGTCGHALATFCNWMIFWSIAALNGYQDNWYQTESCQNALCQTVQIMKMVKLPERGFLPYMPMPCDPPGRAWYPRGDKASNVSTVGQRSAVPGQLTCLSYRCTTTAVRPSKIACSIPY